MRTSSMHRSAVLATVAMFALLVLLPGVGSASQCHLPDNEHCYALTSWHMTNGELVLGGSIQIDTLQSDVPSWASGYFYTNEMWAPFASGHWIEAGQYAGEYRD